MPTNRKRTSRKPVKSEEPEWKEQFRKAFKKFPNYEDFKEATGPWDYEQWKFTGELIRAEGPHFKKVGKEFIQID
jgi:hypothetical protein